MKIYTSHDFNEKFENYISSFFKKIREPFLNRNSSEPIGFVSDKIFVHIEPFTNLTVRIIVEDQSGYSEDELLCNKLAFKNEKDGLVYVPWTRLGLDSCNNDEVCASDCPIISLDNNKVVLDGYTLDEDLLSDIGIKKLVVWLIDDLKFLKNQPYLYPLDLLENKQNLVLDPFNVPAGEYLKKNHFVPKKFLNQDELKRDLQSFICQYAGSVLVIDHLNENMLDKDVQNIFTVPFIYKEHDCVAVIRPNQDPPELLVCSVKSAEQNEWISHDLGVNDLKDTASNLSSELVKNLTLELNHTFIKQNKNLSVGVI